RHDFNHVARARGNGATVEAQALRTMDGIARSFAHAFPRAQFAIALGNNDSPCGDYRSALRTPYLAALAHIWAPLVNRGGAAPGFERDFAAGGHYTAGLPIWGLRLIALDDVPLASEYAGDCGAAFGYPPAAELRWLESALASTPARTRNVVLMHLPPGFDAFVTQRIAGLAIVRFLYPDANAQLLEALATPANRVVFAIAGHTHRFDFRLDGAVPILVFGSLSPVYHNNPAFFTLAVARDGSIRDISTYAFDEWSQEWQPPRRFDAIWHVRNIDAATLTALHARLEREPAMRRIWDAAASGWPSNWHVTWSGWGTAWRVPWCAQTYVNDGFARCAGLVVRTLLFRLVLILLIALATITLVLRLRSRSSRSLS
ncbi:MAG: hypothetical protein JOZ01_07880, partial [Candidatus Eremiobacteraeota bacterium]|nr:hypothetical protein [Candidatus Eremiobacteraeota bacterium]